MSKQILSTKKEVLAHIVFWMIWVYFKFIQVDNAGKVYFASLNLFEYTWFLIFIGTFYFNYLFVLPKVFRPFKWHKAVFGIAFLYLFFITFRYFIEQFFIKALFDMQNYFPNTHPLFYVYDNLFSGFKPILISTFFWMNVFLIRTLEYNKLILEENKNTEIKFLKAQINPHFIFNTLNTIYSMVYFQSEKSLSAIEKLSQIMRFTTYESQKEAIALSEEIMYIQAYIELEQLRHEDNNFIKFNSKITDENLKVPPYLLLPLIENALKHGVASNLKPIEINLEIKNHTLTFCVKNHIEAQQKDKLNGIGLDNLKKRLEIYYPNNHSLCFTNSDNQFTANLQIHLK